MSPTPRLRPDFEIALPVAGAVLFAHLEARLAQPEVAIEGQVLSRHACLRLPAARRTLLSPYLELDLLGTEEAPLLRGRFAPQPNVWTGFIALLALIAMLGLAGSMYGFAQMTLGQTPLWLWAAPAAAALMAFVCGAAFIGQGLSAEEMFELRAFLQCSLQELAQEQAGPLPDFARWQPRSGAGSEAAG